MEKKHSKSSTADDNKQQKETCVKQMYKNQEFLKFKFCYNPEIPQTLIMLKPLSQMRKLFIQNQMDTEYVCLDFQENSGWQQTIAEIEQDCGINVIVFKSLTEFQKYAALTKNWFVVMCSGLKQYEYTRIKSQSFLYKLITYQPKQNLRFDKNHFSFENYQKSYECLLYWIRSWNGTHCQEKKLSNFVFIDSEQVGKSHILVKTMYAMLNQSIDNQTQLKLTFELQNLYEMLNNLPENLFYSSSLTMSSFFSDLRNGMSIQQCIKWYTSEQVYNYKIINTLLRSSRHPSEIFYIQPYFKVLFNSIRSAAQNKSSRRKFCCYRGAWITLEQQRRFKQNKNKVVLNLSFLSTSLEKKIATGFGSCLIKITVDEEQVNFDENYDYGYAEIGSYSCYSQEKQILFNPLSSFRIKNVYTCSQTSKNIIQLEYGVFSKQLCKDLHQCTKEQKKLRMIAKFQRNVSQRCRTQGQSLSFKHYYLDGSQEYWQKFYKIWLQNKHMRDRKRALGFVSNHNNYNKQQFLQKGIQVLDKLFCIFFQKGKYIQAEQCSHKKIDLIRQKSIVCLKGQLCPSQQLQKVQAEFEIQDNLQDYFSSLEREAEIYYEKGDFQRVQRIYWEIKQCSQMLFGQSDSQTRSSLAKLGDFYSKIGNQTKAKDFYQLAVDLTRRFRGTENLEYAEQLMNLANIYYYQEDFESSTNLYKKSEVIYKKSLGIKIEKQKKVKSYEKGFLYQKNYDSQENQIDLNSFSVWLQFADLIEEFGVSCQVFQQYTKGMQIGFEAKLVIENLFKRLKLENRLKQAKQVLYFMMMKGCLSEEQGTAFLDELSNLIKSEENKFIKLLSCQMLNYQQLVELLQRINLVLGQENQVYRIVFEMLSQFKRMMGRYEELNVYEKSISD